MTVTLISNLAPLIRFHFDQDLLLSTIERLNKEKKKAVLLSQRKIRDCDVGKRRKFDLLVKEFEEVYVRKEIEKAEYHAKAKEKSKERSGLSNGGTTCRFKRYSSSGSNIEIL